MSTCLTNKTITNIDISHNQIPLSDLKLNEQHIPEAIAKNFPAVQEGAMVGNGTADEKAAMPAPAEESAQDSHDHHHGHDHDEDYVNEHEDHHDQEHAHEGEEKTEEAHHHAH